jgi:hypothetical protein
LHRKRVVSKVPLVIFEVRRSERLKIKHQGFKSSPCAGKSYICCISNPPTLSKKVIKCLANEFCNISDSVLNDETLSKKPASKKVAGPRAKQSKKGKGNNKKEYDDNAYKKSKKQQGRDFSFSRLAHILSIFCFLVAVHAILAFFAYCSCSLVILELVL